MIRLEWLFLMQCAVGVLMVIFLQKLIQMKKQVDKITKEVTDYISYVTSEVEEEPKTCEKQGESEAQNRLIQAVLSEYFP